MPDDFQQPHEPIERPSRRRDDSDRDSARRPPAHPLENSEGSRKANLGQFSLLADPTTISGESEIRPGESKRDEINRLRSALYARSREIVALQRDHSTAPDPDPTNSTTEEPEPHRADGQLLNSSQARRLAQDAQEREQAIRAELSSARNALNVEPSDGQTAPATAGESERGWRTRALVRNPNRPESGLPGTPIQAPSSVSPETLLRADIRELQATLSLARDTTRSQKKEIAKLRIQLAQNGELREMGDQGAPLLAPSEAAEESFSLEQESSRHAADDGQIELTRLRDRLQLNDREIEARDTERLLLKQSLEDRENQLAARQTRLDDLQDQFDVQSQALDLARLEFNRERTRNTEAQALLGQLGQALGEESAAPSSGSRQHATRPAIVPHATSEPTIAPGHRAARSDSPTHSLNDAIPQPIELAETSLADEHHAIEGSGDFARPAIFDAWQDDQIRRHFGPMGIDTIIDLLRAPLARRHDPDQGEMSLLLLGSGAWSWAPTLAEGLVRNGTPAFTIYVCDPLGRGMAATDGLGDDRPIDTFLRDLPFPTDPTSLRSSLEEIRPAALISRDFLSSQADVEPWLDVLASASTAGACLLFSERTGVGVVTAPPELTSIGDRIWALMPERYTRVTDASARPKRIASWSEAYALSKRRCESAPGNELLTRLRNRFRLEMLARFGFLAEGFVATSIGANFDAGATRDRKFLSQIADVDDRKIEAGIVPALHLVAVVDHDSAPDGGDEAEDGSAPDHQG